MRAIHSMSLSERRRGGLVKSGNKKGAEQLDLRTAFVGILVGNVNLTVQTGRGEKNCRKDREKEKKYKITNKLLHHSQQQQPKKPRQTRKLRKPNKPKKLKKNKGHSTSCLYGTETTTEKRKKKKDTFREENKKGEKLHERKLSVSERGR